MTPTDSELKIIVEKAVLVTSAEITVNNLVNSIHKELSDWFKKNNTEQQERVYAKKVEQIRNFLNQNIES